MAIQRGTRWQGSALVNGDRKRLAFSTKQEAERFEADPYAYLSVTKDAHEIGILFPQWGREMWGKTANERNALRITDELVTRLGRKTSLTKIDRPRIRELVVQLRQDGNKDGTINSKISKLGSLLSFAVDEGLIDERPKINFMSMPEGRIRSLSREEEEKLFAGLTERHRHLAIFLLYTGCRLGEALNLTWDDVSDTAISFWKTKTRKPRSVPITKQAGEALAWTRAHGWERPFGEIAYSTFIHQWKTAQKQAGLEHDHQVVPHVLRHTCATRLAQGGLDLMRLMLWLGHSNIKTTMRYTHMNVDDLMKGAQLLEKT